MNKLSSLLCQLGLLAIVGGGITFGVAYASGDVKLADCIRERTEHKSVTYEKNERQEQLDVNLAVSKVTLYPSTDDKFTIDVVSTMGRKSDDVVKIEGFSVESTAYSEIMTSIGENIDRISRKTQNSCDIYIPSWYTSKININVIVGSITSYIPAFSSSARFEIVTGDIKVEEVEQISKIGLSTVTGKLRLDVSKVVDATNVNFHLKAVTGKITFVKNSDFRATYLVANHGDNDHIDDSSKNNIVTLTTTVGNVDIETK